MANENTLNVKVPDKLYLALKKAAEQKSISLAALTRMLCSDWIMEQNADIKEIFTFPEHILEGLTPEERMEHLSVVLTGGYKYNQYGEATFDRDDDCAEDDDYALLATPEEIANSQRKLVESRGKTHAVI